MTRRWQSKRQLREQVEFLTEQLEKEIRSSADLRARAILNRPKSQTMLQRVDDQARWYYFRILPSAFVSVERSVLDAFASGAFWALDLSDEEKAA